MMSNSIRPFAVFLMIVTLVLSLAGTAIGEDAGEEDSWDQVAVTKLAKELEQILQEAQQRSSKAPPQQTVLQQRDLNAAKSVIRRAGDMSKDFARRLEAGWGREDSEPYFRAVNEEVELIFDTAGSAVPVESSEGMIDRLHAILDALQKWYNVP